MRQESAFLGSPKRIALTLRHDYCQQLRCKKPVEPGASVAALTELLGNFRFYPGDPQLNQEAAGDAEDVNAICCPPPSRQPFVKLPVSAPFAVHRSTPLSSGVVSRGRTGTAGRERPASLSSAIGIELLPVGLFW